MLNSRLLKSKLPTVKSLLKRHVIPPLTDQLKLRKVKQKLYHDNVGKKELPPLDTGQSVRFLDLQGQWRRGVIDTKHETPRSYWIEGESGRSFRRNLRHIFPIRNTTKTEPTCEQNHSRFAPRTEDDSSTNGPDECVTYNQSGSGQNDLYTETSQSPPKVHIPQVSPIKQPAVQANEYQTRSGRVSRKLVVFDMWNSLCAINRSVCIVLICINCTVHWLICFVFIMCFTWFEKLADLYRVNIWRLWMSLVTAKP